MKMFSELYPNGCSSTERDRLRSSWFEQHGNPYTESHTVWDDDIWRLDSELDALSMLDSCFAYGGIEGFYEQHRRCLGEGSYYEYYLSRFLERGGSKEEFDNAIEAQKRYYDRCVVVHNVDTDGEGNMYNAIKEVVSL